MDKVIHSLEQAHRPRLNDDASAHQTVEKMSIERVCKGVAQGMTLDTWMEQVCQQYQYQPAFSHQTSMLSYYELEVLSSSIAGGLQRYLHLSPGSKVGILMGNSLHFPALVFGILKAGMIAVPLNPYQSNDQLDLQLKQVPLDALFTFPEFASLVVNTSAHHQLKHIVVAKRFDMTSSFMRAGKNLFGLLEQSKACRGFKKYVRFSKLVVKGREDGYRATNLSSGATAIIFFASDDVEGEPQAVAYTHQAVLANIAQLAELLDSTLKVGQGAALATMPLYHSFSLLFNGLTLFGKGVEVVLADENASVKQLTYLLAYRPYNILSGANSLFVDLCKSPHAEKMDFSKLSLTVSGVMPLTRTAQIAWQKLTGCPIIPSYGLTQAAPFVCVAKPHVPYQGVSTQVGKPLMGTHVKLVNTHQQIVKLGVVGELYIKGPQLAQGYVLNGEISPLSLDQQGWYATGDMARECSDGGLEMLGPKSHSVSILGFDVYPSEIENIVSDHADVLECAVVGLQCLGGRKQLKLYAVSANRRLTVKALRDYCRERLTHYKVPAQVEFREHLPKAKTGKINYRELVADEWVKLQRIQQSVDIAKSSH